MKLYSFLLTLAFALPLEANWFSDFEAGLVFNDNVSRAELGRDAERDTALEVFGDVGKFYGLGNNIGATWSVFMKGQNFIDFDDLNNLGLGVTSSLRKKFGLGAYAPWGKISASIEYDNFDNDIRDAWFHSLTVSAGIQANDRWNVGGDLSYELRNGEEGGETDPVAVVGPGPGPGPGPGLGGTSNANVYDQEAISLSVFADYGFSDTALLSFSYTFRDGDVTSTATARPEIVSVARAIQVDNTFDDGKFAYRIDAKTHSLKAGLNRSLGESSSLDFSYEYQRTYGENNNDYENNIFSVSAIFAF